MNETLQDCPVCGNNSFTPAIACKDFVASGEVFSLVRCNTCTLIFTNPRPDERGITPYYQTSNYVSHAGSKRGLIYLLYDIIRKISLRKKLSLIHERLEKKGKLLDVGCGLGYFINAAKINGWHVDGLDVSEEAREFVKKTFQIEVQKEGAIKEFSAGSFDAITLWHVLEHFHQLKDWVADLKRVLAKDGVLFIAVPNSASYDASYYKEYWDGYDVPRHLYHFNHQSIESLFSANQMVVVEKRAMIYDAYYISWRSELHKKTFLGIVRAMIIGQISNWKARKKKNYSSVLYIIKHAS